MLGALFYYIILRMRRAGFTLLEVMLVIIILVIVFVPLLQMLTQGLWASDEVKGGNTAVFLGTRKIETIRDTAYTSITSEAVTTEVGYPAFRRQVTVIPTGDANILLVKVTEYWNTSGGSGAIITSMLTFETMVTSFE